MREISEKNIKLLQKNALFQGISIEELQILLPCIGTSFRTVSKSAVLLEQGEEVKRFGILLEGTAQIFRLDIDGNREIVQNIGSGELFAETLACLRLVSPVTVITLSDSLIFFADFEKLNSACHKACAFHLRLMQNMMKILAEKNKTLSQKLVCLSRRSAKGKVKTFLLQQMISSGKNPFAIPLNRSELADYLALDRSALSALLSKMKESGEIDYHKNIFQLLKKRE